MNQLNHNELQVLNKLGEYFFDIIPTSLQTHCMFSARIAKKVLNTFDIKARLVPCQLWYATPSNNFVIGFLGNQKHDAKWDGHVICVANNWFIDAALRHFNIEFNLECPTIVISKIFPLQTQIISRLDINTENRIWWISAPSNVDITIPKQPNELIEKYSTDLITKIKANLK